MDDNISVKGIFTNTKDFIDRDLMCPLTHDKNECFYSNLTGKSGRVVWAIIWNVGIGQIFAVDENRERGLR